MLQEENTPQVGGKTERTDFMFKEFGIILEIKMIKESDKDEKEFVYEYACNSRYAVCDLMFARRIA